MHGFIPFTLSRTLADFEEDICTVVCDANCELSEWTTWSACGSTYRQTRSRHVTREATGNGRMCPRTVTKERKVGCYKMI